MQTMEQYKTTEVKRLIKWLSNHTEEWESISKGYDRYSTLHEFVRLIRVLQKESFHEIIIFMLYQNMPAISDIVANVLMNEIIENNKEKTIVQLENEIIRGIEEFLIKKDDLKYTAGNGLNKQN